MAPYPRRRDFVDIAIQMQEEARKLRVGALHPRPRAILRARTFVVGGTIDTSLYIPPIQVGMSQEAGDPDMQQLYQWSGRVRIGGCGVRVYHRDINTEVETLVATPYVTEEIDRAFFTARDLQDMDELRIAIDSATSDCEDLSFSLIIRQH